MKYLFISLALFIGLISCRKNKATETPTTVIPKIKSLRVITVVTGPDTDAIDFSYDNFDRVTRILGHNGEPGISLGTKDTLFKFIFYYASSSEKLPYMVLRGKYYNLASTPFYSYKYLTYDSQNRVIKDSTIGGPILKYEYSPGRIIEISGQDTFNISNGNFISKAHPYDIITHSQYIQLANFDTYINPLNYLNISNLDFTLNFSRTPYTPEWSLWTMSSKNNLLNLWDNQTLAAFPGEKLKYIYDQNGLPTKRIWYSSPLYAPNDTLEYYYH